MDNTLILSAIAGMGVGIALVVMISSTFVLTDSSFTPESYYDWSPSDGGLPRIVLTESSGGLFVPDKTSDELNENPFGSTCNDPDVC